MSEYDLSEREFLVQALKKADEEWKRFSSGGKISCRQNTMCKLEYDLAEDRLLNYDKIKNLEKERDELKAGIGLAISSLKDLWFWETCPDNYRKIIEDLEGGEG
jgi:hypothetical protein